MGKTVTSVDTTPLKSNGVNLLLKHVKWTLCKVIYKSLAGKNIANNRGVSPVLYNAGKQLQRENFKTKNNPVYTAAIDQEAWQQR